MAAWCLPGGRAPKGPWPCVFCVPSTGRTSFLAGTQGALCPAGGCRSSSMRRTAAWTCSSSTWPLPSALSRKLPALALASLLRLLVHAFLPAPRPLFWSLPSSPAQTHPGTRTWPLAMPLPEGLPQTGRDVSWDGQPGPQWLTLLSRHALSPYYAQHSAKNTAPSSCSLVFPAKLSLPSISPPLS